MAWISKPGALTDAESLNNAQELVNWCVANIPNVTENALKALMGNAKAESGINPGREEVGGSGYGIFQWTPKSKLTDWCAERGLDPTQGESQMQRFKFEIDNGLQWFANPDATPVTPPFSLLEYMQSNLDITTLTWYFMWYYEHPNSDPDVNHIYKRIDWANNFFNGIDYSGAGG